MKVISLLLPLLVQAGDPEPSTNEDKSRRTARPYTGRSILPSVLIAAGLASISYGTPNPFRPCAREPIKPDTLEEEKLACGRDFAVQSNNQWRRNRDTRKGTGHEGHEHEYILEHVALLDEADYDIEDAIRVAVKTKREIESILETGVSTGEWKVIESDEIQQQLAGMEHKKPGEENEEAATKHENAEKGSDKIAIDQYLVEISSFSGAETGRILTVQGGYTSMVFNSYDPEGACFIIAPNGDMTWSYEQGVTKKEIFLGEDESRVEYDVADSVGKFAVFYRNGGQYTRIANTNEVMESSVQISPDAKFSLSIARRP